MVKNRFAEPSDMQISTEISIKEGQNLRLTVEVLDYVADLVQDNSIAHTTVEAFLDYGNSIQSAKTNLVCSEDCLKGVFIGNIDVRNAYENSGTFKLVINIHAMAQDTFTLNTISQGDLVLASEIFPESKGRNHKIDFRSSFCYFHQYNGAERI